MNSKTLSLEKIAVALSLDYECVFFVDVQTDMYEMYSFRGKHKDLNVDTGGDFWGDSQKNLQTLVYEEDQKLFGDSVSKDFLLAATEKGKTFILKYRLLIEGNPVWYSLKVVSDIIDGGHFLVMGASNIDEQVRSEMELRRLADKGVTYSRVVMALAEYYTGLYLVNIETDHYIQYKTGSKPCCEMNMDKEGDDFFAQLQEDAKRLVYKDDLALVSTLLQKDTLLKEIRENGVLSFTFRQSGPESPIYVNLSAVHSDDHHIIISVMNVDARVRRENEIKKALGEAIEKSRRDDLTGIRNKNAYGEFEADLDLLIKSGALSEFAIALCDVNGLKHVNDTLGHKAGDEYIRVASKLVCETFKHSPVFRIGGDEFVAILRGGDYERRASLEQSLDSVAIKNYREGRVSIACGISVFEEGDSCSADVFKRADRLMYEKKNLIKQA